MLFECRSIPQLDKKAYYLYPLAIACFLTIPLPILRIYRTLIGVRRARTSG